MIDAVECRRLVECHQDCRPMIVETIEDVIGDLEQCRLSGMAFSVGRLHCIKAGQRGDVRDNSSKY